MNDMTKQKHGYAAARFRGRPPGFALIAAFTGTLLLNGCAPQASAVQTVPSVSAPAVSDIDFSGRVVRVVDGDTFRLDAQDTSIRVWGLDAPERGKPGGTAATSAMTRLIVNQQVECRQRDIDRYGRIVGQCFLADGRDIAAVMISASVAQEYCRYSKGYYGTCRR